VGLGGPTPSDKDKLLLILQEKVHQAVVMLENSADPLDIIKMLRAEVDFYKAYPTFANGVSVVTRSSISDGGNKLD